MSEFLSIAINDERIVGVKTKDIQHGSVFEETYELKRNSSVEEDLQKFGDIYPIKGLHGAIVKENEIQQVFLELPAMSYAEIKDMLEWQISEYISWPKDSFYYDFMIKPKNDERIYVLIVAILHNHINDVVRGLKNSGLALSVIDYWPAPLHNFFLTDDHYIMVLVRKNDFILYHWFKGMLVYQSHCSDKDSLLKTMAKSNTYISEKLGLLAEKSIVFDSSETLSENDLAHIYDVYPSVEKNLPFILPATAMRFENNDLLLNMALGLACRMTYTSGSASVC